MTTSTNPADSINTKFSSLSPEIRRHLGARLAAAYRHPDTLSPLDRFSDILARLDAALLKSKSEDERKFQLGLLSAAGNLRSFAISLTKNPTAADDLVQETMLRAWRSRRGFTPGTNLNAWLFTIMRNQYYSVHRKHVREVQDSDGDYAGRLATLPEQNGHLDLQDVTVALDKLPATMREALILVALEDFSYEDAARVMNCQIGTVKSRVWRARQQLAMLLGYSGSEVCADHTILYAISMPESAVES